MGELDPRIARVYADLSDASANDRYGYTTWTFWPPKSDVYIYEEVERVWTGEITVMDYLEGLNELFAEELGRRRYSTDPSPINPVFLTLAAVISAVSVSSLRLIEACKYVVNSFDTSYSRILQRRQDMKRLKILFAIAVLCLGACASSARKTSSTVSHVVQRRLHRL